MRNFMQYDALNMYCKLKNTPRSVLIYNYKEFVLNVGIRVSFGDDEIAEKAKIEQDKLARKFLIESLSIQSQN